MDVIQASKGDVSVDASLCFMPQQTPSVLAELPGETWCVVAEHLSGEALARMAPVCRAFGAAARREALWERLCRKRFPHFSRSRLATPCLWKALYEHHHLASRPPPETLLLKMGGELHQLIAASPARRIESQHAAPTAAPATDTAAARAAGGARRALSRCAWQHSGAACRVTGEQTFVCSPHGNLVALSSKGSSSIVIMHMPPAAPSSAACGANATVPHDVMHIDIGGRGASGPAARTAAEAAAAAEGDPFCLSFTPDGTALLFLAPLQHTLGLFCAHIGSWASHCGAARQDGDRAPAVRPVLLARGAPMFFCIAPDSKAVLLHVAPPRAYGRSLVRTVPIQQCPSPAAQPPSPSPVAGISSSSSQSSRSAVPARHDYTADIGSCADFNTPIWAWLSKTKGMGTGASGGAMAHKEDAFIYAVLRDPANPAGGTDIVQTTPRECQGDSARCVSADSESGHARSACITRVLVALPPVAVSLSWNGKVSDGCALRTDPKRAAAAAPPLLAYSDMTRMAFPAHLGGIRVGGLGVMRLTPASEAVAVPQVLWRGPATDEPALGSTLRGGVAAFAWSPSGEILAFLTVLGGAQQWEWRIATWDPVANCMVCCSTGGGQFFLPRAYRQEWLPFFDQYAQSYSMWREGHDEAHCVSDGRQHACCIATFVYPVGRVLHEIRCVVDPEDSTLLKVKPSILADLDQPGDVLAEHVQLDRPEEVEPFVVWIPKSRWCLS